MSTQEVVNRCLLGLVVVLSGAVARMAVVKGEDIGLQGIIKRDKDGRLHGDIPYIMTALGPSATGSSDDPQRLASFEAQILSGDERDAFLKAHNNARAQVHCDPLVWSDEIARFSLDWLIANNQKCIEAVVGPDINADRQLPRLEHRPRDGGEFTQKYGENSYASWSSPPKQGLLSAGAVSSWLKEKEAFDALNSQKPYVQGDANGKTDADGKPIVVGHYTQMIWKDTKKVGAAKWVCRTTDSRTKDGDKNETQFVVIFSNYDPEGNMTVNGVGQSPLIADPK